MRPLGSESGFSLIEVAIALGIVSFAVVILLALLPVGLSSSREGSAEEAATELLAAASADIRNASRNAAETPLFHLPLNPSVPNQTSQLFTFSGAQTSALSEARLRLTVTTRTNANPSLRTLYVAVTWPPQADLPSGTVETLVMRALPPRL